jgi:cytochrome c biogenesis protein CcmG/thiol:disulfide interchange protein DsbE
VTRVLPAVAAAIALLVSACTSTQHRVEPSVSLPTNPSHARLLATAGLDACPRSAPTKVSALPDVTLPCLGNGPRVRLAGLGAGPTLVHVWGSWCEPCQRESPFFSRVYDSMKTKLQFLGVDDEDSVDSALDFAAHVAPPMRYPSVVDDDKKVLLALHTIAVPITVFVVHGRLVHTSYDPYRSTAALRADIARYLGVSG